MATKRRNTSYENRKQKATEIGRYKECDSRDTMDGDMTTVPQQTLVNGEQPLKVANGEAEERDTTKPRPPRIRTVSWQEEVAECDIEAPGTPKTPRTSTTPALASLRGTDASSIYEEGLRDARALASGLR
ncbi:hypothetical protein AAG570_001589 [Ranatra chinensis]|uniref:Uncharacterized protein n=1 Tax=Ranatra chinensis TaxID=642074 RepID=A0ABD0YVI5_9HEMI